MYSPPLWSMMAPPVGGPANVANAQIVATIPNLVPILRGSFVKLANDPTKMPWLAPVTIPRKAQKTYMSDRVRTPIHPKRMTPNRA
jgi:hypothetical protein